MGRHRSAAMQNRVRLMVPRSTNGGPILLAASASPEAIPKPKQGNQFRRCGGGARFASAARRRHRPHNSPAAIGGSAGPFGLVGWGRWLCSRAGAPLARHPYRRLGSRVCRSYPRRQQNWGRRGGWVPSREEREFVGAPGPFALAGLRSLRRQWARLGCSWLGLFCLLPALLRRACWVRRALGGLVPLCPAFRAKWAFRAMLPPVRPGGLFCVIPSCILMIALSCARRENPVRFPPASLVCFLGLRVVRVVFSGACLLSPAPSGGPVQICGAEVLPLVLCLSLPRHKSGPRQLRKPCTTMENHVQAWIDMPGSGEILPRLFPRGGREAALVCAIFRSSNTHDLSKFFVSQKADKASHSMENPFLQILAVSGMSPKAANPGPVPFPFVQNG